MRGSDTQARRARPGTILNRPPAPPRQRLGVTRVRLAWHELPSDHRRWLVINALFITAVINLMMNGLIAWWSARGMTSVPLLPTHRLVRPSLLMDTVGTLFLLPYITSLLCTTAVWQQRRRVGLAAPAGVELTWRRPPTRRRRGLLLGSLCLVLAPILLAVLAVANPHGLSPTAFVIYKAVLGVALGALVTPLIAIWALSDPLSAAADPVA